jgi:hypothetical protein
MQAGQGSVQVAVTVAVNNDPHRLGPSAFREKGQVNAMAT